jgi:hypothetical protein
MKRLSFILLLALSNVAYCQNEKTYVAIMPFVSVQSENKNTTAQLQEKTLSFLKKKIDLEVIDRSKDSLVLKELRNQTRSVSVIAKGMADQGKLSGATDILVGTVTNVGIGEREIKNDLEKEIKYSCIINFSLQIIDVATGTVKKQMTLEGSTKTKDAVSDAATSISRIFGGGKKLEEGGQIILSSTKEAAIDAAVTSAEREIGIWLNKLYPVTLNMLSVESRNGKYPETVLIGGLDETYTKGTKVKVIEVAYLADSNGKKFRQEKKIGTLKILERQGEVCLCRITDGEKDIEEKIDAKKILLVTSN